MDDPLRFRSVMVVDDQEAARLPICEYLARLNCRVSQAGDGEEALALIAGLPDLDLLIADVVMPRLDGPGLVEKVLSTHPAVKVLFISGFTPGPSIQHLMRSPRVDFLAKPFSMRALAARAARLLGEPELGRTKAANE